ncbi:MAG: ribonuclease D, partial [Myxococcota bacterium]|nr:ribonuclease D [Myxococcota bacterium]
MLITTSSALAEFCDALRSAPYIAVDTEFIREKTYHARLCLVQVAYGDLAAAIDPLANGMDMAPLRDLLCDPKILKVLHAATQDLEIFLDRTGQVPAPVFDTQIAASVCGLGESPGYAKLVASLLNVQIDKASQVTDWSLRPLSSRQ